MIFTLADELAMILTEALQDWFNQHPLAQEYRWFPNADTSKVHIYEQYPDQPHRFPSITVKGLIGETMESGMGQMAGKLFDPNVVNPQDPDDVIGESFAGWYNPKAEYVIESTHDADVRRIADLFTVAMIRSLQYDVPSSTGNNVMLERPLLRVTGRGTRTDDNNRVIKNVSMSQTWKVTWHDERKYEDDFLKAPRPTVTFIDC